MASARGELPPAERVAEGISLPFEPTEAAKATVARAVDAAADGLVQHLPKAADLTDEEVTGLLDQALDKPEDLEAADVKKEEEERRSLAACLAWDMLARLGTVYKVTDGSPYRPDDYLSVLTVGGRATPTSLSLLDKQADDVKIGLGLATKTWPTSTHAKSASQMLLPFEQRVSINLPGKYHAGYNSYLTNPGGGTGQLVVVYGQLGELTFHLKVAIAARLRMQATVSCKMGFALVDADIVQGANTKEPYSSMFLLDFASGPLTKL